MVGTSLTLGKKYMIGENKPGSEWGKWQVPTNFTKDEKEKSKSKSKMIMKYRNQILYLSPIWFHFITFHFGFQGFH